jgi:hypothetical protein
MATKLFMRGLEALTSPISFGRQETKLDTTTSSWSVQGLSTSQGTGVNSAVTNTVAGPTNGVELNPGFAMMFISDPVDQDVLIDGTITANIWASESNMSANVAINVVIDVIRADDQAIEQIVKSTRTTEVAITTPAVNNFTTGMTSADYTAVQVLKGDRIRIRIFGDDAGTMASGFTFNANHDGATPGADGDAWVEFTETFGFLATTPAGTQLFLLDAAGPAVGANTEREMWTSRGASAKTDVVNTATGFTNPIQVTDTAGGTAVEWYSRQLQAFTLADLVRLNLRVAESNGAANCGLRAELAVCDGDGSNVVVWAVAGWAEGTATFELGTTEAARVIQLAGDDLAVTTGQRLRLRVFIDDPQSAAMVTGHTVTLWYDGPTGGASGDSWIQLTQSVSEAGPATSLPPSPAAPRLHPALLHM